MPIIYEDTTIFTDGDIHRWIQTLSHDGLRKALNGALGEEFALHATECIPCCDRIGELPVVAKPEVI